MLNRPTKPVAFKSLGRDAGLLDREVAAVRQLGATDGAKRSRTNAALVVEPATGSMPVDVVVFAITTK